VIGSNVIESDKDMPKTGREFPAISSGIGNSWSRGIPVSLGVDAATSGRTGEIAARTQ